MLWVVLAVVVVFGVLGTVVVARGRVAGRGRTQALPRPDSSPIPMSAPAARDTARVRPPVAPPNQVLRVPASAARQPARPTLAPRPAPAAPAARPAVAAPVKPTVLVVDDSATMQRSLEGLFRQAGYSVACAADGQLALAWVESNGMPALITLDLEMPNLNGVETLHALQQLSSQAPVHAVFITGKGPRLRETSGELGAIGYFNKPYDGPALLALAARVAPLPA